MIKKNNIDLWDGFDNTESVYDDRKEKQFHSRIWHPKTHVPIEKREN